MQYELYVMDVAGLADTDNMTRFIRYAGEERAAQINRLAMPDDRARALGAGLLLSFAMGKHGICLTDGNTVILYGKNGKPYIKGGPEFNLSHSGTYAVCAVSSGQIGVDIQSRLRRISTAMIKRCFTENENKNDVFEMWSAKESYLKAIGTGITTELSRIEAVKQSDNRCKMKFDGNDTGYICNIYDLKREDYALTVCINGLDMDEKIPELRLVTAEQAAVLSE